MEAYIDDPELFNMMYKRDVKPLSISFKTAVGIVLVVGIVNFLFTACSMWTINENTRPFCEAVYLV